MALHRYFNERATYRTLENPAARVRLPDYLTHVEGVNFSLTTELIERNMTAAGLDPAATPRLNIAWPQKHPHSGHFNAATETAHTLRDRLTTLFPGKDIVMAHAIYETVKLGRSESQTPLETFTRKQIFEIDTDMQDKPLPFLREDGAQGEAFLLCDWSVSQGTTLANLASFITHNGGKVVGLVAKQQMLLRADWEAPKPGTYLHSLQQGLPLKNYLSGLLAEAAAPVRSYSAAEAGALFETVLQKHGLTMEALTRNEINTLKNRLLRQDPDFATLVEQMGMDLNAQDEFVAAMRSQNTPSTAAPVLAATRPL